MRLISTILILLFFVTSCTDVPLKGYEPKTNEEKEIITVLIQYQETKNRSDIEQFLALLYEKGQFSVLDSMVSKSELKMMLPNVWTKVNAGKMPTNLINHEQITGDYFPHWKIYNPKIMSSENAANVTVMVKFNWWWGLKHHIRLLEDNGQWVISHICWETV